MLNLIFFALFINCHIFMQNPPSRRNKYSNYYLSNGLVDYNLMAPLNEGYTFPCKGYPKGPSTKTINGNIVSITLEGTATHNGGHCQFGITYDNNQFIVLKTVISDCLLTGLTYNLELPSNIPSGEVTIFWTWINRTGNREYYMECADITINNPTGSISPIQINGKELLVANFPGYPMIPEGLPPGNDGVDLLNARKDISILSSPTTSLPTTITSLPLPSLSTTTTSLPTTTPLPTTTTSLPTTTTSLSTTTTPLPTITSLPTTTAYLPTTTSLPTTYLPTTTTSWSLPTTATTAYLPTTTSLPITTLPLPTSYQEHDHTIPTKPKFDLKEFKTYKEFRKYIEFINYKQKYEKELCN